MMHDLIIHATSAGNQSTNIAHGGAGFDYGRGVAIAPFSGSDLWVAGSFEESILVGTLPLTSAGGSDAVLANVDAARPQIRQYLRLPPLPEKSAK